MNRGTYPTPQPSHARKKTTTPTPPNKTRNHTEQRPAVTHLRMVNAKSHLSVARSCRSAGTLNDHHFGDAHDDNPAMADDGERDDRNVYGYRCR